MWAPQWRLARSPYLDFIAFNEQPRLFYVPSSFRVSCGTSENEPGESLSRFARLLRS